MRPLLTLLMLTWLHGSGSLRKRPHKKVWKQKISLHRVNEKMKNHPAIIAKMANTKRLHGGERGIRTLGAGGQIVWIVRPVVALPMFRSQHFTADAHTTSHLNSSIMIRPPGSVNARLPGAVQSGTYPAIQYGGLREHLAQVRAVGTHNFGDSLEPGSGTYPPEDRTNG